MLHSLLSSSPPLIRYRRVAYAAGLACFVILVDDDNEILFCKLFHSYLGTSSALRKRCLYAIAISCGGSQCQPYGCEGYRYIYTSLSTEKSMSATRCHATDTRTRVQSIVDVHVSRPRRLKAFEPIRAEAFSIFMRRKFRARCWLRRWQRNPSVTQYKHRKVTHTAIRGQSKR